MIIEDGDLFKNDDIGTEVVRNTFTTLKKEEQVEGNQGNLQKVQGLFERRSKG